MDLPQLRHPPLKLLIVPGRLHSRIRRLPQILGPALSPFLIGKVIIGAMLLLRIPMTGTGSFPAKHVLLHHRTYTHALGFHEPIL
jgi:hypothetical protein